MRSPPALSRKLTAGDAQRPCIAGAYIVKDAMSRPSRPTARAGYVPPTPTGEDRALARALLALADNAAMTDVCQHVTLIVQSMRRNGVWVDRPEHPLAWAGNRWSVRAVCAECREVVIPPPTREDREP